MEEIVAKGKKRLWPAAPSPIRIPGFTETEVAAAEQLVQLSESSGESSPGNLQRSLSSALSSSSSPISVGSIPYGRLIPFTVAEDAEAEEDDGVSMRLRPRYRSIAEIYADFGRIDGDGRRRAAGAAEAAVAAAARRKREDFGGNLVERGMDRFVKLQH